MSTEIVRRRSGSARAAPPKRPRRAATRGPEERIETLYTRIGEILHLDIGSEADVVAAVRAGIPAASLAERMAQLGAEVVLVGPDSTIRRRVQAKQNLTVDESERLVRLARVRAQALELYRDQAQAQAWLTTPRRYLEDHDPITPYELAVTDAGARLVEGLILKTAHGIF